ncbi:MAG: hypothetical protein OIN85_05605 [Candidatus Methanoperedens sp.]|nr:hypothetical protein [Candidatus Methanoperedens sp.]
MSDSKVCEVCGCPIHPLAYCCKRCKKLIDRVDMRKKPDKGARIRALKKAWDGQGFLCYYSGIRLIEDNPKDPRYLTFDHRTPRQENDIVVSAHLLNDMKSDLAEDEFKDMIIQLASHFRAGTFEEKVFNLKYWKR